MLSEQVQRALTHDRTVDITTTGRRSGQPRRIEIGFHNLDGRLYISGLPGRRGWYANVVAHPDFEFHLKESAQADIPARAHPITDPACSPESSPGSDARARLKIGSITARSSRWNY
jgi:deazaflavin-dependent oxidoreductase (nitroreductase family)